MSERLYGCYSESARRNGGGVWEYESVDGRSVQVTCVCLDPECAFVVWPDKVLVGEVVGLKRVLVAVPRSSRGAER